MNIVKYFLIITLSILFIGCKDDNYLETIYNKKLLNQNIKCIKLQLDPFSNDLYNFSTKLYDFSNDINCNNTLNIRYKSNIICNSPFNKDKSLHSFVELSLSTDGKTYYSVYKDLKDNSTLNEEIKYIFNNYISKRLIK